MTVIGTRPCCGKIGNFKIEWFWECSVCPASWINSGLPVTQRLVKAECFCEANPGFADWQRSDADAIGIYPSTAGGRLWTGFLDHWRCGELAEFPIAAGPAANSALV